MNIFKSKALKGKSLVNTKHQVGRSDKKRDKSRKAMPPGKRLSKSGRIYYESRKNRSDLKSGI